MSAEIVDDLVDMVEGGEAAFPKAMTLDRLIPHLEDLRNACWCWPRAGPMTSGSPVN